MSDDEKPVWLHVGMLFDPQLSTLNSEEWCRLLDEAIAGKQNGFSKYVSRAPDPNLN